VDDSNKSLWELLWDYDPNGLIVVDQQLMIRLANPAFCRIFKVTSDEIAGKPAADVLPDADELAELWAANQQAVREKAYPQLGLAVRQVIFTIPRERIFACIVVDVTEKWRHQAEIARLKRDTIERVNEVVNNQMKVAHSIASLLGETTAESRASLLKLVEMIQQEDGGEWS
jgi:PAS domain S-box-containing protein